MTTDQPRVSPPLPPPPSEAKSAVPAPPPVPAPAAKQLASSSDATAASRSVPSSQAKPSAPSAGAGGEGGGASEAGAGGGVVQQDGLLAELMVSRNMLAQLVEGQQQVGGEGRVWGMRRAVELALMMVLGAGCVTVG